MVDSKNNEKRFILTFILDLCLIFVPTIGLNAVFMDTLCVLISVLTIASAVAILIIPTKNLVEKLSIKPYQAHKYWPAYDMVTDIAFIFTWAFTGHFIVASIFLIASSLKYVFITDSPEYKLKLLSFSKPDEHEDNNV